MTLEKNRSMAEQLIDAVVRYTESQTGESPYSTPVDGVVVLRADQKKPPVHRVFTPAICFVAQGAKWAMFGESKFEYKAGEALVVGIQAPSLGRVTQASPDKPCLVLALSLDLTLMRNIAQRLDAFPQTNSRVGCGVFVTDFDGPLTDCVLRLFRLFDTPAAIPILYPLVMQEICYWLLTGPHGAQVARLTLLNHPSLRIKDALDTLRDRFAETLHLDELAAIAQLSPSAFHRQFKALTSLTPLQYQKELRLLEARRLMVSQGANVETAAFKVGYESQSQFSREYSRMFGSPPKKHLKSRLPSSAN
ncbi:MULTISPECIES: AraC family transcriptional regulator [unclassified Pseudomonas]|uniref:AraC family transcriptional regulator n=1 Tax=unclassified Pseudomonas TaxID=196821 RepID=UPI002B2327D9|nr:MULTISPECIES: AraC family transcriptional regulator [unclassified Pseudomonas]MEA9979535.1 AraC family transcriptional regulator [Pseudomonas sp. RTS4]MEB0196731.1 AraC family transcriptional regulator [Pseudomonas sp. 5S4]MEB0244190.1 AraC family transcriptional regulator [Pseudomonas sp. 10S5]